jgi:hypothetical protein
MSLIPLIDALTPLVDKALSFIPDPQEKEKQREFLLTSLKDWDAQQAAIDQQEAASPNLFIAGWRPFIGWVCGVAFAYHFILQPLITYVAALNGHKVDLPVFDMQQLSTVLMGMLGLGGLRTVEKIKGVS